MEDKELWVILYHGLLTACAEHHPISTVALMTDSALREYKQRWDNKQLVSTEDEEVGKWVER
jgi:hypothetical protein